LGWQDDLEVVAGVLGHDKLDQAGLWVAACLAIYTEIGGKSRIILASLPMSAEFRKLFQDWTAGRIDFVEIRSPVWKM
jgi:hypothetical protein